MFLEGNLFRLFFQGAPTRLVPVSGCISLCPPSPNMVFGFLLGFPFSGHPPSADSCRANENVVPAGGLGGAARGAGAALAAGQRLGQGAAPAVEPPRSGPGAADGSAVRVTARAFCEIDDRVLGDMQFWGLCRFVFFLGGGEGRLVVWGEVMLMRERNVSGHVGNLVNVLDFAHAGL